jgi:ABC-2 type transport system ATP-binding protein
MPLPHVRQAVVIDVTNLTKNFGETVAVDGLSFHIDEGEVFGFLGPNGAGKTTTMRMLCCLISKTSGEARIAGYEIGAKADALKIRGMIGLVPDNVGLYEELSAYDNLDYYGKLFGCTDHQRKGNIEHFLRMMDLWEQKDKPVGSFSKGMKQKTSVARALIHDPKVLFLDEPTASLDPESARVVTDFILELKGKGKTIFLNTHNLDEAQKICDRIGIIRTRLLAVSTPEQLRRSIWGNKTVVQLKKITETILSAVRALNARNVTVDGNQLIIDVADPLQENPAFVKAIVSAGGDIQYVSQLNPDLEETYLKLMRETK